MRTHRKVVVGMLFFLLATVIPFSSMKLLSGYAQPATATASTAEHVSSGAFLHDDTTGAFHTYGADLHVTALANAVTISTERAHLQLHFVDSNPSSHPVGQDVLQAVAHLYLGNDPSRWQENLSLYNAVMYQNLYDGIDLVYAVVENHLKSEFILQPGISPETITLQYDGNVTLVSDRQGGLEIVTPDGVVHREFIPAAYQIVNGHRVPVAVAYRLIDERTYTFVAQSPLDPTAPLIIDPILIQATYFGGTEHDEGRGIARDREGSLLISGVTWSYPELQIGGQDIFVTKIDATGNLEFITLIGGSAYEDGNCVGVDGLNNVYVAGETTSEDFPVRNAWQPHLVNLEDAYVLKLTSQGTLVYSSYIGGTGGDEINDMYVDEVGNTYVGGETYSDDFPLLNPWSASTYGPEDEDGFISIFDPDGQLIYSTFISAEGRDQIFRLTVDDQGNVYVTGMTSSPTFPTVRAAQRTYGGGWEDCMLLRLDPGRNEVAYSTFLGGTNRDACWGIDVDQEQNVYVTGYSMSLDFPTHAPLQSEHAGGGKDVIIAKFDADGQFVYSTYWGGSEVDAGQNLALDDEGNLYIVGATGSDDFPLLNAMERLYGGGEKDAFLMQLNPDGSLGYASFVGGNGDDRLWSVRVGEDGIVNLVGFTTSTDMRTRNPVQNGYAGGTDAFIARHAIVPTSTPTPIPTPTPTPTPFATASIDPEGGLIWLEYPGHLTLVTVPGGAIDVRTIFTLTYDGRPSFQGELSGVDHFFQLEAQEVDGGPPISSFPTPLELTLGYNDPYPVVTHTVTLYRLQAGDWTTHGITITVQGEHFLNGYIDHTGYYGVMGHAHHVFLPTVLRSTP
jgi:hypothetical protein